MKALTFFQVFIYKLELFFSLYEEREKGLLNNCYLIIYKL